MFDSIYDLAKLHVQITCIENGYLISINKPLNPAQAMAEGMKPMISAMKDGEQWKDKAEKKDKNEIKPGAFFFRNDEPDELLSFLSKLILDGK
jgi:surfactin synthase thioesterase subunit